MYSINCCNSLDAGRGWLEASEVIPRVLTVIIHQAQEGLIICGLPVLFPPY